MIYLRQVAPAGAGAVPGDTLHSPHLVSPSPLVGLNKDSSWKLQASRMRDGMLNVCNDIAFPSRLRKSHSQLPVSERLRLGKLESVCGGASFGRRGHV